MEKRKFEKLGIQTSLLGFGAMRLPVTADGKIDEPLAEKMIDKAIAAGVNYIDTAYPYHNRESEPFVGKVLNKYARDSYYLATKLPQWFVNSLDDAKRIFNEQLARLDKEYVDFYLIHALNGPAFDKMVSLGVVTYLEELKAQGKIKFLGFSFHSTYEDFEHILTYRDWDFCQIQYNYMDTEEQAGDRGYALAEKLGIPLVIMEPVKGGALAVLSPDLDQKLKTLNPTATPSSYAFRWVGSHPNVKVILSGMTSMEQVEDNLHTFEHFKPLSDSERSVLKEIRSIMESRNGNGCTGCRYCMPCPSGVDIPACFKAWNKYRMYQNYMSVQFEWEHVIKAENKPDACIQCGTCETLCPQHLNIREDLEKVQAELSTPKAF
jgi:uncharacterized protein